MYPRSDYSPQRVPVVLADQMGISVGDLFLGALTPGIGLHYGLYVIVVAVKTLAPALPLRLGRLKVSLISRVPKALLPIVFDFVLGSILWGLLLNQAGPWCWRNATGMVERSIE